MDPHWTDIPPRDSVNKIPGHSNIKTEQIYTKVSDKKISDDTKSYSEIYVVPIEVEVFFVRY